LSEFTDNTPGINPNVSSYRYKISTVDTLGFESCLSDFHKTIHLQISLGLPPAINLSWDDYIGFPTTYYRILRDSTGLGNWEVIDSVAFDILSRTDPNPPQTSNLGYMIEAVPSTGCTATLMKKGKNYNTSKSNKANKQTTGIDQSLTSDHQSLIISPNPTKDKLTIEFNSPTLQQVSVNIYNLLGGLIYKTSKHVNSQKEVFIIDLTDQPEGLYYVKVRTTERILIKKIVLTR